MLLRSAGTVQPPQRAVSAEQERRPSGPAVPRPLTVLSRVITSLIASALMRSRLEKRSACTLLRLQLRISCTALPLASHSPPKHRCALATRPPALSQCRIARSFTRLLQRSNKGTRRDSPRSRSLRAPSRPQILAACFALGAFVAKILSDQRKVSLLSAYHPKAPDSPAAVPLRFNCSLRTLR